MMAEQTSKRQGVEVQPRATRRTFSAEYKRRILAEADASPRGQAIRTIPRIRVRPVARQVAIVVVGQRRCACVGHLIRGVIRVVRRRRAARNVHNLLRAVARHVKGVAVLAQRRPPSTPTVKVRRRDVLAGIIGDYYQDIA
jgi:hypothetical protein